MVATLKGLEDSDAVRNAAIAADVHRGERLFVARRSEMRCGSCT